MKLRLYHHHDGARIAYRETGTGPPLALLHSAGLSHREFEPLAEELGDRFRLVLPDLPLHGDSEDGKRHPYTPQWLAELVAGFLADTCGPRPLVGGHDTGAQLVLRAVLELGYASAIRREWVWRTSRGESTANLDMFAGVIGDLSGGPGS